MSCPLPLCCVQAVSHPAWGRLVATSASCHQALIPQPPQSPPSIPAVLSPWHERQRQLSGVGGHRVVGRGPDCGARAVWTGQEASGQTTEGPLTRVVWMVLALDPGVPPLDAERLSAAGLGGTVTGPNLVSTRGGAGAGPLLPGLHLGS